MNLPLLLALGLAGGLGAVLRFLIDSLLSTPRPGAFPVATLLVNVTGSLLLGVVTGLFLLAPSSPDWAVVAGSGFCGGFTTFSTTSVATVRLAQEGRLWPAVANGLGTLVLCVGAAATGLALTAT